MVITFLEYVDGAGEEDEYELDDPPKVFAFFILPDRVDADDDAEEDDDEDAKEPADDLMNDVKPPSKPPPPLPSTLLLF